MHARAIKNKFFFSHYQNMRIKTFFKMVRIRFEKKKSLKYKKSYTQNMRNEELFKFVRVKI